MARSRGDTLWLLRWRTCGVSASLQDADAPNVATASLMRIRLHELP
ncbi:hypothetical protein GNF10_30725 [Nostoc sp. UCD121]|nr:MULTISPECIES: hypothetical protein [unclassified Nostoc]MBC1219753.1 hypothetical protein [Nostoc sp. UCD120]MBC1280206.1 hypothetical protein [Nostoc sp. UCD121]MBC1297326.1 hypothetical protein [Nostoc sp. UCD122]